MTGAHRRAAATPPAELSSAEEQAIRERFAAIPIFRAMRFELFELRRGEARCRVPWNRDFDGIFESFHGGLLLTVADSAAAVAVLSATGARERITTTDMSIRFLAPVRSDVSVTARVLKLGRTLVPVEADLRDADGQLAAVAQITYMRLPSDPDR